TRGGIGSAATSAISRCPPSPRRPPTPSPAAERLAAQSGSLSRRRHFIGGATELANWTQFAEEAAPPRSPAVGKLGPICEDRSRPQPSQPPTAATLGFLAQSTLTHEPGVSRVPPCAHDADAGGRRAGRRVHAVGSGPVRRPRAAAAQRRG